MFTSYLMPNRVINQVNEMGKSDIHRDAGSQMPWLEFRNRLNERFDWDNDDLGSNDPEYPGPTNSHPDIPATQG